ncbi:unnamed protein product [Ilex paraguariensis]|uniref:Peroxin/Ferlin domain-containing protein n=1 Tax=Ilex paraguariensis TaxID=185542 RepID=A0ABC8TV19_9AQUA
MIFQAYASWNNLSDVHESCRDKEAVSTTTGGRPIIDVHHIRSYVIPQNKLGQDIFIRAAETRGLQNVIQMPSGDMKPLKVPVLKNMLESHLKGNLYKKLRPMVTIIIADAEFPRVEGLSSHQYAVTVRLTLDQNLPSGSLLNQQSARTCGTDSPNCASSDLKFVIWNEMFFFKVDSLDCCVVEFVVTDMGRGEGDIVGYFSAPLKQIADTQDNSYSYNRLSGLKWLPLSSLESRTITQGNKDKNSYGKIRCAVILSPRFEVENGDQCFGGSSKSGFIQISPTSEGPWTTVRLNYAARAACLPFGKDVVASEVTAKDGNRYVTIRSLVSIRNNTDFILDLCLKLRASSENMMSLDAAGREMQLDGNQFETDEFFETQKYNPTSGWVGVSVHTNLDYPDDDGSHQGALGVELPSGWEWVDDWHIDKTSVNTADGWVYAPDFQSLKWPESYNPLKFVNYARQRRWIRDRKRVPGDVKPQLFFGPLKPGETVSLPLTGLTESGLYILQLRPSNLNNNNEYAWSSVMDRPDQSEDIGRPKQNSEICVSSLTESEKLFYCSEVIGSTSNRSHGMWFCVAIQAMEIAKDIHSNSIEDWKLVVKAPLCITNYLPFTAEYSVLEMQASGHFLACSSGVFNPGGTVKVHNADIRNPLFFSLLPQRGWLPIHEAVLISHPSRVPSKTISLRSSISGRIVQIILEHNHNKESQLQAKIVRIYSPYWFAIARCPSLTLRLIEMAGREPTRKISLPFHSKKYDDVILEEITEEEIYDGYTIASVLNLKLLGLSVSVAQSGKEHFGPVKDLSPLGDMDGSLDICAYDDNGNCIRLFITSKPCPYQSVPTKVISIRPFMTFTNRLGQNIFVKLGNEDEPKVLRMSDARVSFVYRETGGSSKLQVRLEDTEWSFPVQIMKEDTIFLVLRKHDGTWRFLKTEIRGYEEGSRFIVVFRLGSTNGPIRIENRASSKKIRIRQSGFGNDAWIQLEPLSTACFSWEDPYGQKFMDAEVCSGSTTAVWRLDLNKSGICPLRDGGLALLFHVVEIGDVKVARFVDERTLGLSSNDGSRSLTHEGNWVNPRMQSKMPETAAPLEVIVEFGVLGVSVVDHRPKELSYLYLERVFISYLTGYDGGTTSRLELLLGYCLLSLFHLNVGFLTLKDFDMTILDRVPSGLACWNVFVQRVAILSVMTHFLCLLMFQMLLRLKLLALET